MTGILPAVVKPELEGGNLILVVVVALIALGALGMAAMFRSQVLAAGEGTDNMKTIALAVQEGANAYLTRQFRTLAIFAAIAFFALLVLPADDTTVRIFRSVFFIVGAGFSAAVGYLGMNLAVRANLRVAAAAETTGREPAMTIGLRTGAMVGMLTVGLGLLGASLVVLFFQDEAPDVLEGFGFGAALLAMFMRVGGGIFTKAADVGADLVGKVEQGIPEDDPRNAATIADNVGDNVGDCAGMAADLFESYAVTLVAALILGSQAFGDKGLVFPLLIPAIGALTAVAGVYLTKPKAGENGLTTINKSFYLSSGIAAVASIVLSYLYLPSSFAEFTNIAVDLAGAEGDPRFIAASAVVIGIVMSAGILALTGYYTGTEYRPVKDVGKTSLTGPATVILSGLSVGFESAVYTTLVIGAAVFGAYLLGGAALTVSLFAVALAGCGLLTTVGVIVAMDTFGPVSDNAQGIAEMSGDVSERARRSSPSSTPSATPPRRSPRASRSPLRCWPRRRCSARTPRRCSSRSPRPTWASTRRTCWTSASSTRRSSSACCSVRPWCSSSPASPSTRSPALPVRSSWRSAASSARSPASWRAPVARSTARSSTSSPRTRCASS